MKTEPWMKALWVAVVAVTGILYAANLFLGELNQDEGWYLYGGRMVVEGKLPYVDFACTQGPVMFLAYALAQPLVGLWGVAGGRLFTALMGVAAVAMAAWLAARLAPPGRRQTAAFLAFAIGGLNVYQSYFFTIVKTYSLCGLLLASGFVALTFAEGRRRFPAFLAGVLMALAAGTRISSAVVVPVVFAGFLVGAVRSREGEAGDAPRDIARAGLFALGAAAAAAAVFLPFLLKNAAGVWFAMVEYHAGRQVGGLTTALAYKAGFISRLVQAYFAALAILACAVLYRVLGRAGREADSGAPAPTTATATLWCSIGAVTLVHFLAPFPYEDYQAFLFPLLAAALAVMLAEEEAQRDKGTEAQREPATESDTGTTQGRRRGMWVVLSVAAVCLASSFSSPVNQDWFVGPRDRIWWPLKDEAPLHKLQRVGSMIRSLTRPGDVLLTQDPYLAVETGLSLPPGLELGQFSYFPDWSREKALSRRVLNREMMRDLLAGAEAPVAAFSGYGFAIQSPSVTRVPEAERKDLKKLLETHYSLFREIEAFGQAATRLEIFLKNK